MPFGQEEGFSELRSLLLQVLVVCAYGQKLGKTIWQDLRNPGHKNENE